MKKVFAFALIAWLLSGCQTTGAPQTVEDTVARVCPPVKAIILVLENSPTVDPDFKVKMKQVSPAVTLVCSGESIVTYADLHDLANQAFPVMIEAVTTATLSDDQKNYALLSIAVAQAVISTVPK